MTDPVLKPSPASLEAGVNLINLTPHPVVIRSPGWDEIVVQPSGVVARLREDTIKAVERGNLLVRTKHTGQIVGLPPQSDDTLLIVSMPVALAARRPDVVCPDDLIRDDQGRVVACAALANFA